MYGGRVVECLSRGARGKCAPATFCVVRIALNSTAILKNRHNIGAARPKLRERVAFGIGHIPVDQSGFSAFAHPLRRATPAGDELAFGGYPDREAIEHGAAHAEVFCNGCVPGNATTGI